LYHLLLALALAIRVGCLPLERSSGLGAILNEMGQAAAVETMIVVVSLVGWRKARPWALLLGLWCRWSIESDLLGWPGYPSAWYIVLRWGSGSSVLDQPIPWRLRRWGSRGCLPFLFSPVGWDAILLGNGHIDQFIESISLYQI
jgi:hypothetical protein